MDLFFPPRFLTGTDSLVNNFGILSKVPISATAFPLAETCSAFVNFLLSLPVLLGAGLYFGVEPSLSWLVLPVLFCILFLLVYCLAFIAAIANVYMRDVRHLIGIGIQIWMYMTPILYGVERIPDHLRSYFLANPMFCLFDSFHKTFLFGEFSFADRLDTYAELDARSVLFAFALNLRVRFEIVEKI